MSTKKLLALILKISKIRYEQKKSHFIIYYFYRFCIHLFNIFYSLYWVLLIKTTPHHSYMQTCFSLIYQWKVSLSRTLLTYESSFKIIYVLIFSNCVEIDRSSMCDTWMMDRNLRTYSTLGQIISQYYALKKVLFDKFFVEQKLNITIKLITRRKKWPDPFPRFSFNIMDPWKCYLVGEKKKWNVCHFMQ